MRTWIRTPSGRPARGAVPQDTEKAGGCAPGGKRPAGFCALSGFWGTGATLGDGSVVQVTEVVPSPMPLMACERLCCRQVCEAPLLLCLLRKSRAFTPLRGATPFCLGKRKQNRQRLTLADAAHRSPVLLAGNGTARELAALKHPRLFGRFRLWCSARFKGAEDQEQSNNNSQKQNSRASTR